MLAAEADPQPKLWVGDLGFCDRCGGLTRRGACDDCFAKERHGQIAQHARLRPSWVFVVEEQDLKRRRREDPGSAFLVIPHDLSQPARYVADALALIASGRLALGDTLSFALGRIAAGRDWITGWLRDVINVTYDRKTVARALDELCERGVIRRVDQLTRWIDKTGGERQLKKGAYVYALNVRFRSLGSVALRALTTRSVPRNAAVRGTGRGRRIDGCLSAAVRLAQIGQRNRLGHWLACRCTDVGLNEGEAMRVLRSYHAQIADGRGFAVREVERTVRSQYQRTRAASPVGTRG